MVIIYTNESNPAAVKLLICANLGKKVVEVINVNITDKSLNDPRHLPYLEVNESFSIFSSNAGAKLLFPCKSEDEQIVDQWLQFEATQLAPSLAYIIGGSTRLEKVKATFIASLKTLNEHLNGKSAINGKNVTVCDAAIWATLYPLMIDANLVKEHLETHVNILSWLKKLEMQEEFKKALTQIKLGTSVICYQAMLTGAKYLVGTTGISGDNQSPTHSTAEIVSEIELNAAKTAFNKSFNDLTKPKKDVVPIMPVAGEKNILITSALPYVNNVPHLGNIIGCVLSADVFARFSRLCNWNTLLVCGTDEYGTATETKAIEEGLTPREICDKYFEIHNAIYRWFNIGFDSFGRTSTPEQTKLVQEMFLNLNENGFINTQDVDQLLCEKCNRFLADRFVEGGCPHPGCTYDDARGDQCDGCGKLINAIELKNPKCKVCSNTPIVKTSTQFFIDLPKVEPLLLHWIKTSSSNWTHNAQVITKSWMREGLKPRCITRDLKWGIPVPIDGFRDKVFYVWFDAPIGYMSITERYTKEWRKWWQPEKNTKVSLYQFMAKDNVPFHSVMFPASLMGANKGYTLVSHIMATEYLNYEDGKFSKSRGVGVFGTDAQNTGIPSDVWRFYLLYVRPEGQDSSFSWVDLATKNNSELLNNLGNFINRALVFAEKNFNSIIPKMNPTEDDYTFLALCTRELKGYLASLEKAKLRDGIRFILAMSKHGNQYMQSTQPWVLLKGTDQEKERSGTVIGICCNIVCLLATLIFPYMPESSRNLKTQLNAPDDAHILTPECPEIVTLLAAGHQIGKPAPLFIKIEPAQIEEMKKKFGGSQKEKAAQGDGAQNIIALEKAVQEQADKVRTLKSSGSPKPTWQPEVAILLELKKKLEAAQKIAASAPIPSAATAAPGQDITTLEKAIQEQGEKVRALKSGGTPKASWQPEVAILLDLKKQLEAAQKAPVAPAAVANGGVASAEDIKKMEEEVEKQGLVVRNLKGGGASKAEIQPQVDKLLELKGRLAVAKGEPLALPGKAKKSKK